MAKKKATQALTAPHADITPPCARLEFADGLPDDLPTPGKPVRLMVEGVLQAVGLKEYPSDRDSVRVRISKVSVAKGRRKVDADEEA